MGNMIRGTTTGLADRFDKDTPLREFDMNEFQKCLELADKSTPFGDTNFGKMNGHVVSFNANGGVCAEYDKANGMLMGRWNYYGHESRLRASADYDNGVLKEASLFESDLCYTYYPESRKCDKGEFKYSVENASTNESILYNTENGVAQGPAVYVHNGEESIKCNSGVVEKKRPNCAIAIGLGVVSVIGILVFLLLKHCLCLLAESPFY